jgi:hypothetical protein
MFMTIGGQAGGGRGYNQPMQDLYDGPVEALTKSDNRYTLQYC